MKRRSGTAEVLDQQSKDGRWKARGCKILNLFRRGLLVKFYTVGAHIRRAIPFACRATDVAVNEGEREAEEEKGDGSCAW